MDFTEDVLNKLKSCIEDQKVIDICKDLEILKEEDSTEIKLEKIEEYIDYDLVGRIRGQSAIVRFLRCINSYIENDDLVRINDEGYSADKFVDFNLVLPIKENENGKRKGFRVSSEVLGADRNRYILKTAEGLKGGTSGKKNTRYAIYNPTIAYAFFKYLGEECAEAIPGLEKEPYYYIFSKNFLKENQEMISIGDEHFTTKKLVIDENNNITHQSIIEAIEDFAQKSEVDSDKLKMQYAVQETIKKMICSMDENLGNTSFVISKDIDGNIENIDISPAYDLDISFTLGEEMQKAIGDINQLNRVSKGGEKDLKSMIQEFKTIPGYMDKMQEFIEKFQGEYTNEIFDIAYESTKIDIFKNKSIKEVYDNFIMRRVALFKEACKDERENILNKE